jgi:uncharacterized membrane protein YdfJ with MMPL/SSD domain
MKRTPVTMTALFVLLVGGHTAAHAQDDKKQRPDSRAVTPQEQHQRVQQEQQRATQYKEHLDQQVHVVQQQTEHLQEQRRPAQYHVQQEYTAQLVQQQQHLQTTRDFSSDPFINAPRTYRYVISGTSHQTNQYGVDVLRQAVNLGYQQGLRAGDADRIDHWDANYRTSVAYRDANVGYAGSYVDQDDYNYYFREGFRRGYDDGFNRRSQYGSSSNGSGSILGTIVSSILGLQSIH